MIVQTIERPQRQAVRDALAGLGFVLAGLAGIAALIFITNSADPLAERAMFRLGLAGAALLSAIAQVMVLYGGWRIWRAAKTRRGA